MLAKLVGKKVAAANMQLLMWCEAVWCHHQQKRRGGPLAAVYALQRKGEQQKRLKSIHVARKTFEMHSVFLRDMISWFAAAVKQAKITANPT